jgi:transposase
MLAEQTDYVIGVDTHRDRHSAAILASSGGVVDERSAGADRAGYRRLLGWAQRHAAGRRVWAIEGTGSYGAGLVVFLDQHGERVIEIGRRIRRSGPSRAKSDPLDAIEAAREALTQSRSAAPRGAGEREALRVLVNTREGAVLARTAAINQLRALIVAAPEPLRANLRGLSFAELVTRCARLRPSARDATSRASALALRSTARRIQALSTEARQLTREITQLVDSIAPELLAEPGVGPISAARILIAWSHRGRFRSEAAFAMLAGASPIPASSGQTVRHRLNRGGDRQLNRALHTIALSRRATHRPTRDYIDRRIRDGKTTRDINRCLKRYLARHLPQSRALPADPQTRMGTRPHLPLKRAPRPRPVRDCPVDGVTTRA